nr:MAG: Protein of unknown function (DUF2829) [Bacteriophage sp.]
MSKETFDFSEALRRMKEGKKVRRVIWEECGAYIHIVSETIVAVCDGKFFPCVFKDSEDILATDWEEVLRMKKNEKCCGNCHWFDNEDVYGVGWCSNNEHESSCDQVCDEYEF